MNEPPLPVLAGGKDITQVQCVSPSGLHRKARRRTLSRLRGSGSHPRPMRLGGVERLHFLPGAQRLFSRRAFFGREEFAQEIDVADLGNLREGTSRLIQTSVLAHEIPVGDSLAGGQLIFSPSV